MAEPGEEAMLPLLMENDAREPSSEYVGRLRWAVQYVRALYFCLMGGQECRFNHTDQERMQQRLDASLQGVMDARRRMAEAPTPADFGPAQADACRLMDAAGRQRRKLEAIKQTLHLMEGLQIPP